jgi:hypothetical protein
MRKLVEVEFVGGPWDGYRQALVTQEQLDTRRSLGAWMLLGDYPWPPGVPEGCVPRAVYEPEEPPAPAHRWVFQGYVIT